jgi:hypothetical protein
VSEWVDLQMSHHLAPVQAPDELWQRLQAPRPVRRRTAPRLAIATAAAVLAAIVVAYSATRPRELPRATFTSGTCNLCHTM